MFLLQLVQFVGENAVLVSPRVFVCADVISEQRGKFIKLPFSILKYKPDHVNITVDDVLLLVELLEGLVHTLLKILLLKNI